MTSQELQVRQKREREQKQGGTVPARSFIPNADIYETVSSQVMMRCTVSPLQRIRLAGGCLI